jgi:hypothetical protein
MINAVTFDSVPEFGTGAVKVEPEGSLYASGYIPTDQLPAEHLNWFLNSLTANGVAEQDAINAVVAELDNLVTGAGLSIIPGDSTQVLDSVQALIDATIPTKYAKGVMDQGSGGLSISRKVLEIGDWNMDSTTSKSVAHGLDSTKILSVSVWVRNDADTARYPLDWINSLLPATNLYTTKYISSTDVVMQTSTGSPFDNANFDATSYNRGWILIEYSL